MSTEHEAALRRMTGAMNAQPGIEAADKALRDALERARVVGVLDAWAATNDEFYWVIGPQYFGKSHYCTLWSAGDGKRVAGPFQAETPDAARAAAAKAIENGEV